jgi:hypothetical protein
MVMNLAHKLCQKAGYQSRTFCFVYEPAPGHSLMISSFASLFVAKAKATPEKVVPCNWEHQHIVT